MKRILTFDSEKALLDYQAECKKRRTQAGAVPWPAAVAALATTNGAIIVTVENEYTPVDRQDTDGDNPGSWEKKRWIIARRKNLTWIPGRGTGLSAAKRPVWPKWSTSVLSGHLFLGDEPGRWKPCTPICGTSSLNKTAWRFVADGTELRDYIRRISTRCAGLHDLRSTVNVVKL